MISELESGGGQALGFGEVRGIGKSGGGGFVGLDKAQLSFGEVQGSRRI